MNKIHNLTDDSKIQQLTVLTIEDDEPTRKMISLYLKRRGFRVVEAHNGLVGVELFRKENPGLILVDLRMPEMDGLEVLEIVSTESPSTPIIVISGTGFIRSAIDAIHRGAWDYILKPIQDMSILDHHIEKALERARLIAENKRYQEKLESDIEERTRELTVAILSLTREINERERIEAVLRENEKTYRAIFNATTAALFIIDLNRDIIEANMHATKYFDFSQDEFRHLPLRSLIVTEDHPQFNEFIDEVIKTGLSQAELNGTRRDGSVVIMDVLGTEVVYKSQKNLLIVFMDITERKRAEEKERLHQQQLIQADKMASLGVLVSGVAHEINNPNNFIMVNAPILDKIWKNLEHILDDYYNEKGDFYIAPRVMYSEMKDKVPGIITGILEGAKRIANFVTELKNFARPAPPTIDKNIDIHQVIQSAVTLLSNLIKNSTNRFSTHFGEYIPEIRGNFQRLEQVIINLIENSCQALENKNQAVSVSTEYDATRRVVKIIVKDEGRGMTPEILDKIKTPFFTTRRENGGTGLGLSISSKIIEEHLGTLELTSSPRSGTTATIQLNVDAVIPQTIQKV